MVVLPRKISSLLDSEDILPQVCQYRRMSWMVQATNYALKTYLFFMALW